MAFNVGASSKDTFKQLKKLTPRQRVDYVNKQDAGALLSMLTPQQFAELFPNYYKKGLPDVSGFQLAISKRSTQKQDDINFGLSQGAKTVEQAEQYGQWRRRFGGEDAGRTTSTTGSTRASGSLATNQREAYKAALSEGLSPSAAKILVANMSGESLKNPSDHHWDVKHMSQGIVQWDPQRAERIKNHFGAYPKDMSVSQQTKAAIWEMKTYYSKSYAALTNETLDPQQRMHVVVSDYERPADVSGSVSARMSYFRGMSVDAADPQTSMGDVSRVSTKSGGYYGESEQCVALSKHFSGLGAASGWKVRSGNIGAGTVIATMSYNDGSGGKMAKDMPDGRSHYHTGIALNSPNSNGDVLILEQFSGQPARVRMININNYNGERWGVVEGGDPNAGTMRAVEMAKGIANPDQLALIDGTGGTPSKQASVEVKPVQEAPTARPTAVSTEQQQQYPADQQPQQAANKQTATVEKTDKSKKTVESYKFDPDKYYNEVNSKHPEAKFFGYDRDTIMRDTYKGFEEAQAAGAIKWNKKTNEIQIVDPNHEKIQAIYQDMQKNNIDRNAFLTKSEAGGSGTAKVSKGRRRLTPDTYSPEVTETGLSRDSRLIDYSGSKAAKAIGISDQQYNAFREAVASIESSGGKYQLRGGSNKRFSGAYQIGGKELQEVAKRLGETAPTMRVKGKRTPVANEQFLNDPNMQERYFDEYVTMHHERLMKNKKYAAMAPEDRIKIHGMAHNAGAGAASKYLRTGQISRDAAGTHPEKYAHRIGTQLAGLKTASNMAMASATPARSTPTATGSQTTTGQNLNAPMAESKPNFFDPYTSGATASTRATPARNTPSAGMSDTTPRTKTDPILTPQPDISTGVTPAGPEVTRDTMQPVPDRHEQNTMNMQQLPVEKPQKETIIDASLSRQTREFPTESLARAMGKVRGFETGTGADGYHHSTTALG